MSELPSLKVSNAVRDSLVEYVAFFAHGFQSTNPRFRAMKERAEKALTLRGVALDDVRDDAFNDGVILALQVLTAGGDCGSAHYVELLNCCDVGALVRRAVAEEMMELSGLNRYLLECLGGAA